MNNVFKNCTAIKWKNNCLYENQLTEKSDVQSAKFIKLFFPEMGWFCIWEILLEEFYRPGQVFDCMYFFTFYFTIRCCNGNPVKKCSKMDIEIFHTNSQLCYFYSCLRITLTLWVPFLNPNDMKFCPKTRRRRDSFTTG